MAIRKIAQLGEPVLRQVAAPIAPDAIRSERVQSLIEDMIETMRDADGAGIAAPQVYESLSVCVIEVNANPRYPSFPRIPLLVLVNPIVEVVTSNGSPPATLSMYEGCLSVTGIRGKVTRPRRVRVQAQDRNGNPLAFEWEGIPAAIVQHETDHLNGVLFVDRAEPKTLTFLREYERHVPFEQRIVDAAGSTSG
jgi:peptide deformylase